MIKLETLSTIVLITLFMTLAPGCTHLTIKDAVQYNIEPQFGVTQIKSMGETLLTIYECPCYEYYETTSVITFSNNGRSAPRNKNWVARYINTVSKEKYLVNESFHRSLALVLLPGTPPKLSVDHAMIQVEGVKKGRTWSLVDPEQSNDVRLAGYKYIRDTWRLQYIGPDKESSQILRFTIDDLRDNGERVGQIEYAHDLSKGKEFVVRGVRFRINDVSSDGLITYEIVDDNK